MEKTYSYSSHDSSPHSNSLDTSWDEQQRLPPPPRVKFMCSYNGKIHPRAHDNQLAYVGGETKILAVDRTVKFSSLITKLASLSNLNRLCFKYQLPGEDLDALISVTNDEDLEHMMFEYDRLVKAYSAKPARLRLFLFAAEPKVNFEVQPERQWFVDALNSVSIKNASPVNPDYLFGLDKKEENRVGPEVRKNVVGQTVVNHDEGMFLGKDEISPGMKVVPASVPCWNERHVASEQQGQVYLVPTGGGIYQQGSERPLTSQGYYYWEQPVFNNPVVPPQLISDVYGYYDGLGRQMYYTAPDVGAGVGPTYQVVSVAAPQEVGKVVVAKPSPPPSA